MFKNVFKEGRATAAKHNETYREFYTFKTLCIQRCPKMTKVCFTLGSQYFDVELSSLSSPTRGYNQTKRYIIVLACRAFILLLHLRILWVWIRTLMYLHPKLLIIRSPICKNMCSIEWNKENNDFFQTPIAVDSGKDLQILHGLCAAEPTQTLIFTTGPTILVLYCHGNMKKVSDTQRQCFWFIKSRKNSCYAIASFSKADFRRIGTVQVLRHLQDT